MSGRAVWEIRALAMLEETDSEPRRAHMTSTRIALIVAFVLALAKTACAVDLEVSELVGAIKHGIAEAKKSASPPKMKIPWIEAEISYVVKQEGWGGGKLSVMTGAVRSATETVRTA